MMSKTSTAAKARWNKANYDFFKVSLPRGCKDRLKAACEQAGVSMNSVFQDAAQTFIDTHPPAEKNEDTALH